MGQPGVHIAGDVWRNLLLSGKEELSGNASAMTDFVVVEVRFLRRMQEAGSIRAQTSGSRRVYRQSIFDLDHEVFLYVHLKHLAMFADKRQALLHQTSSAMSLPEFLSSLIKYW